MRFGSVTADEINPAPHNMSYRTVKGCLETYPPAGGSRGPKRPHKQKDPTDHGFPEAHFSCASEPECRILMFISLSTSLSMSLYLYL